MSFINLALLLVFLSFHFPTDTTQSRCSGITVTDTVNLYLTFDDGIVNGSEILQSVAASSQTPVNIFVIGKFALKNDTTRQIWQEAQKSLWIESGNHSFSHANSRFHQYYTDPFQVLADFRKNEDSLGLKNRIARLPGRNVWRISHRSRDDLQDSRAIADTLAANGYQLIGWDLEWNYSGTDLSLESEDDLIFRIQNCIRYGRTFTPGHLVILCHDPSLQNPVSEKRLRAFIEKIKKAGKYRFSFLSNYPGVR